MPVVKLIGTAVLIVASALAAPASGQALGYFEKSGDVGQPAIAGSTAYDPATQTYTIAGSGTNMWATRDEFHFAWRKMTGDFIVRTHATLQGTGVDPHRKIGWIIRKTLDADSPYVDVAVHGDGLTSLQFRKTAGAITEQVESAVKGADVVQLARKGRTYTMSVARFGDTFTHDEVADVDLGDEVYVGLFVCAHNPTVSERAVFKNVRIVVPPKDGWVPYRDYIGSNLEVMDIATGDRTVVSTSPISVQAPNWTRDGKELIYNSERQAVSVRSGQPHDHAARHRLCDLEQQRPRAVGRRHDARHQPSADRGATAIGGLHAAIVRRHAEAHHGELARPICTAGRPTRSSWSTPAGATASSTSTGFPSDGGEEMRLTTTMGLDDGPEYSPDGQWIYFNSLRTRPDADLAHEAGRQRPGAADGRRVQQLVPAPVAGRKGDDSAVVPRRRQAGRAPVLSAGVPPPDAAGRLHRRK